MEVNGAYLDGSLAGATNFVVSCQHTDDLHRRAISTKDTEMGYDTNVSSHEHALMMEVSGR